MRWRLRFWRRKRPWRPMVVVQSQTEHDTDKQGWHPLTRAQPYNPTQYTRAPPPVVTGDYRDAKGPWQTK